MNISSNMKAIDVIKGEILSEVANLYRALADYDCEDNSECISNEIAMIIAMDYILARRLGISYKSIDDKITRLLDIAVQNGHELEAEFSDMSELNRYVNGR